MSVNCVLREWIYSIKHIAKYSDDWCNLLEICTTHICAVQRYKVSLGLWKIPYVAMVNYFKHTKPKNQLAHFLTNCFFHWRVPYIVKALIGRVWPSSIIIELWYWKKWKKNVLAMAINWPSRCDENMYGSKCLMLFPWFSFDIFVSF